MGNTLLFLFSDFFSSQGIRRFMSQGMMGDIYDQIAYRLNCFCLFRTIHLKYPLILRAFEIVDLLHAMYAGTRIVGRLCSLVVLHICT